MTAKVASRRWFLGMAALASGAVLAACASNSTPSAAPTTGGSSTSGSASAPTSAPAATSASTASSATAAPAATTASTSASGTPAATSATSASAQPAATTAPNTTVSGTFRYAIDNQTETRQPAVDLFLQKNYPNVKARYEVSPQGYFEKLLAEIAAKTPPDLAYIHESEFLNFASQGALQDLDPYMTKLPLIGGNDKYPLEILKPNNWYQGKWYTMPLGTATYFIRYNKTMFQKAGVPLPTPSWTWDDMYKAAAALTNAQSNPKVWGWIGWNPGWVTAEWPLLKSNGGMFFNDDATQCILNNAEGVATLDYMRKTWIDKPQVSPTPAAEAQLQSGTTQLFESGYAAIDAVLSPNVISSLKLINNKFEMGIEVFPTGPKGYFIRGGGSEMSIPVGAKMPDLAWETLRYLLGDEEANKLVADWMDGNPLLREDYILKYNVPAGPLHDKMSTIVTDFFNQNHGTTVQYSKIGTFGNICSSNMDKLAAGQVTAKQCADAIVADTNKQLQQVG